MPYRAIGLMMGLAGVIVVAAMLVMRRDVQQASRSGPAWRRKLISAGLVLLTAAGLVSCRDGKQPAAPSSQPATSQPAAETQTERDWQQYAALWQVLEEIPNPSGKPLRPDDPYAFYAKYEQSPEHKQRVRDALAQAKITIADLKARGEISDVEANLLQLDMITAAALYGPNAATEPDYYEQESSLRSARLQIILKNLPAEAGADKVNPRAVVEIVLALAADLPEVVYPGVVSAFDYGVYLDREDTAEQIRKDLVSLISRLPMEGELQQTPQWLRLMHTWDWCEKVTKYRGEDQYPFSMFGQRRLRAGIFLSQADLPRLSAKGLLSQDEERVLSISLAQFADYVSRYRPFEQFASTCYLGTAFGSYARSLERLVAQSQMLEKFAASRTIPHEAAVEVMKLIEQEIRDADRTYMQKEDEASLANSVTLVDRAEARLKDGRVLSQTPQWRQMSQAWQYWQAALPKLKFVPAGLFSVGAAPADDTPEAAAALDQYLAAINDMSDAGELLVASGHITRAERDYLHAAFLEFPGFSVPMTGLHEKLDSGVNDASERMLEQKSITPEIADIIIQQMEVNQAYLRKQAAEAATQASTQAVADTSSTTGPATENQYDPALTNEQFIQRVRQKSGR